MALKVDDTYLEVRDIALGLKPADLRLKEGAAAIS